MVDVRVTFRDYESKEFTAFTMTEAVSVLEDIDIDDVLSVHIYPNK